MMYGWDLTGTNGWMMLIGMAIVAGLILATVWLAVYEARDRSSAAPGPVDILRERFARGEITLEQFEASKRALVYVP